MTEDGQRERANRTTDGDTVLTLQIKKKYIAAILSLLAAPGGFAVWKTFSVEERAAQADKKADVAENRAINVQEKTDDHVQSGYNVMRPKLEATSDEAVQCRLEIRHERLRIDRLWEYIGVTRKREKILLPPSPAVENIPLSSEVTEPLPTTVDEAAKKEKH